MEQDPTKDEQFYIGDMHRNIKKQEMCKDEKIRQLLEETEQEKTQET